MECGVRPLFARYAAAAPRRIGQGGGAILRLERYARTLQ